MHITYNSLEQESPTPKFHHYRKKQTTLNTKLNTEPKPQNAELQVPFGGFRGPLGGSLPPFIKEIPLFIQSCRLFPHFLQSLRIENEYTSSTENISATNGVFNANATYWEKQRNSTKENFVSYTKLNVT
ncbi:hypothetical protein DDZ16_07685 [Marinilabilia rubra]|uniref:Uncharacterized protein n=1 Tax=Marinilabilia rubra TaxID=2162893 RepID=A0A2U2B9M3_9BACT|nr:hypothetical protein DDZ16_07685 [Marinilabilia rubra]